MIDEQHARIHRGLYGKKTSLRELQADLSASVEKSHGLAALMLACGQDVAYVTESATGYLDLDLTEFCHLLEGHWRFTSESGQVTEVLRRVAQTINNTVREVDLSRWRDLPRGRLPLAARSSRIVAGHPEGFPEGFANIYSDAAEAIAARRAGVEVDPLAMTFPNAEDGTLGVIFVYPTDGLPEEVTMEWDLFNERIQMVPAAATDQAGPFPQFLEPRAPVGEGTHGGVVEYGPVQLAALDRHLGDTPGEVIPA